MTIDQNEMAQELPIFCAFLYPVYAALFRYIYDLNTLFTCCVPVKVFLRS